MRLVGTDPSVERTIVRETSEKPAPQDDRSSLTISRMPVCRKHAFLLLFGALLLLTGCLPADLKAESNSPEDEKALKAATQALCKTQVATVGEIATHGDGHTLAFKVALVERLVHLNQRLRAGDAVHPEDLLTAVGGLWKFYREFQPLAPFLLKRAQSGRVFLGGLDDQLGQLGQDYANIGMITDLTRTLPHAQRESCTTALHKRIYSDSAATAPYAEGDRSQVDQCLEAMQAASSADTVSTAAARQNSRR